MIVKNILRLTDSPCRYLQLLIHVKLIFYGEINNPINPFQCSRAKLNLPGDKFYTPKLPWVIKVISDGHISSEVFIQIDDVHIISHSELVCWQEAKRFCSIFNSLVIHDAYKKRTEPSLTQGPWAGTMAHTLINEVVIIVTEFKWGKKRCPVLELDIFME